MWKSQSPVFLPLWCKGECYYSAGNMMMTSTFQILRMAYLHACVQRS
jgi:hypothetical protein